MMGDIRPNHAVLVLPANGAQPGGRDGMQETNEALLLPPGTPLRQVTAAAAAAGGGGDTFYRAIGPVLLMAQCFGLMPVDGTRARDLTRIQFRWLSAKLVYSGFGVLGALITTAMYLNQLVQRGKQFSDIVNIIFFVSSAIAGVLFIRLARNWLHLNEQWLGVECAMRKCRFQPNIRRRIRITTAVIMSLAFVEHVLSIVKNFNRSQRCALASTAPVKAYFGYYFAHAYLLLPYSEWVAVCMEVFIILATFAWNFTDLFVILMCALVAERFRQLNKTVQASTKVRNEIFWKEIREDYTRLAILCNALDNAISHIVTLAFANNLFFICVQLFHTLKPLKGLIQTVYFVCSFGFLLGRTAALSVYCCWINDESKQIMRNLFEISSEDYGTEASRLIQQIAYCPVVITGSNYFSVTRSLCLQVAGAIITFELILVQLGPIFNKTEKDDNIFCLV